MKTAIVIVIVALGSVLLQFAEPVVVDAHRLELELY